MMRDDSNLAGGMADASAQGKKNRVGQEPRLTDREVPLTGGGGHGVLHDWLDGEVEQARAREAEGGPQVELWTKINAESEMLRRRTTPMHVQKAIMSALPDEAPDTRTSRLQKRTGMSPVVIAVIAAAVLAGGVFFLSAVR